MKKGDIIICKKLYTFDSKKSHIKPGDTLVYNGCFGTSKDFNWLSKHDLKTEILTSTEDLNSHFELRVDRIRRIANDFVK